MIFSIDPGSEKTGIAVIRQDGTLVEKHIIPTAALLSVLQDKTQQYTIAHIVMGDGTNHKPLQVQVEQWLQSNRVPIDFSLVNEKFTTVEGRRLYFQYTPLRGWRRFIPRAWQYPPAPVDDFVAWIIGKRYLEAKGGDV